jgi:hypothetical protein
VLTVKLKGYKKPVKLFKNNDWPRLIQFGMDWQNTTTGCIKNWGFSHIFSRTKKGVQMQFTN